MQRPLGAIDIVFSCTTAATLVGLGLTRLVVGSFAAMFQDFGSPLPTITVLAIVDWPTGVVALLLLVLLGLGLWRRQPALLIAATTFGAIAIAGFFWGMYAPIWELAGNIRAD